MVRKYIVLHMAGVFSLFFKNNYGSQHKWKQMNTTHMKTTCYIKEDNSDSLGEEKL